MCLGGNVVCQGGKELANWAPGSQPGAGLAEMVGEIRAVDVMVWSAARR